MISLGTASPGFFDSLETNPSVQTLGPLKTLGLLVNPKALNQPNHALKLVGGIRYKQASAQASINKQLGADPISASLGVAYRIGAFALGPSITLYTGSTIVDPTNIRLGISCGQDLGFVLGITAQYLNLDNSYRYLTGGLGLKTKFIEIGLDIKSPPVSDLKAEYHDYRGGLTLALLFKKYVGLYGSASYPLITRWKFFELAWDAGGFIRIDSSGIFSVKGTYKYTDNVIQIGVVYAF